MSTSATYVRVDTVTVSNWKSTLEAINADCVSCINNFKGISSELSSWKGNSGTTADEIAQSLISQANGYHQSLESVDGFLQNLVVTKSEQ